MSRFPRNALLIAALIFAVDQALKYWITVGLDLDYLSATREITSFFRLTFVANCGISLGLLQAHTGSQAVRWGVTLVTSAIAGAVLFWLWREKNPVDRLALGCVFGGALGNIADRLLPEGVLGKVTGDRVHYPGCVIDFADLHFGDWRPFLVFNVADAAITIGVLVLLVRALLGREKRAPMESINA
ncbi:signal peptidase II [Sphingomonas sp.]|uniref:signal peptidase II n=1 Tax=Sphingomonas sp. TaxID=28214 RepID=UPI003CC64097